MARVRTVSVRVTAEVSDLEKKLQSAQKSLRKAGKQMQDLGGTMTKGLTVPLVALGASAFASAEDLDKAYSKIREGTGATGKDLEGLKDSFKAVFKEVPHGADAVAGAIADLNTRTGLTGKSLEALTKQFFDLADASGEDLPTMIANGTRAFGDWGIAVEDQTKTMDFFFKVSQSTGIGVNDLMNKVVQFGAPLRQMGFDFETSAALLGKFEKEGVNSELVMGSMRQALGRMAKEGIGAEEGLKATIEAVKNAGSVSEANAISMELFGARAGPDMAAAIREGRFEVDDLIKSLNESGETIAKAGAESETFSDIMIQFKNQTQVALEPLGKILIQLAEEWLPKVTGALEKVANWFNNLSPEMQKVIVIVGLLVAAIGPLLILLGTLSLAIGAISLPVVLVVAGIAALIAIGVLLYQNWEIIIGWAKSLGDFATEGWGRVLFFIPGIGQIIAVGVLLWKNWETIIEWSKKLGTFAKENWDKILFFIPGIGQLIAVGVLLYKNWDVIKGKAVELGSKLGDVWDSVLTKVTSVWDTITTKVKNSINSVIDIINSFISRFNGIKISIPRVEIPSITIAGKTIGGGSIGGQSFGVPQIPSIPKLETGTNFVPQDMIAMLHRGEAVVPEKFNPANGGAGTTINVHLDGRMIAQVTAPHMVKTIRQQLSPGF